MEERILAQLVEAACKARGVDITALSDGWVFILRQQGQVRRIVGSNLDFNNQASTALVRDKVAAAAVLEAYNIDHMPHYLLKSRDIEDIDEPLTNDLLGRYGALVVKPLEGSSGNFIAKVEDVSSAMRFITEAQLPSWTASPFFVIVRETRLIMYNDNVMLAYEKTKPVTHRGVPLFNLSKGATAKALHDIPPGLVQLAARSMNATGLRLAAVDIVTTIDGRYLVLEMNASFSLSRYAQMNTAAYDETAVFYERIIGMMFDGGL